MKITSVLIIAAGILLMVNASDMDTTVEVKKPYAGMYSSGMPDRVSNLQLMEQSRNKMYIGGVMVIAGAILLGFSLTRKSAEDDNIKCPECGTELELTDEEINERKFECPECRTSVELV